MTIQRLLAAACAVFIGIAPMSASAVTYTTEILFTPQGDPTNGQGPTSLDPANGNRVVLKFETDVISGNITEGDLDFLSITLFGSNGFIFEDIAIVDGMATPLAGLERTVADDIDFRFGTNRNPGRQLRFFDNDFRLIVEDSEEAVGESYNIFYDNTLGGQDSFIDVVFYDAGVLDLTRTVVADGRANFTETTSIPLPATALLLFSALFGGAVLARKRAA